MKKFKEFVNEMKKEHPYKSLIDNDSIVHNLPAPYMNKRNFINWLTELHSKYESEQWDWILSTMVNDDDGGDEEIESYFIENNLPAELVKELLSKRSEFLCYGLIIPTEEYL